MWQKIAVLFFTFFQTKNVSLYVLSVQIRILAIAWHRPCGIGYEELTPLLQRKLTRVASNTLTISHSQRVAFLHPWLASNVPISSKFTVLDMELLVPEMGFPLIQIETDTDAQGAVSELLFFFFFIFFLCFSLPVLLLSYHLTARHQVLPLVSKM